MAIVVGIDEAGYGPTLGPLIVSGAGFRVPDRDVDQSLWVTLRECCTEKPGRGHRLLIADSKVVYRARGKLAPLERSVLAMLAVAGKEPGTWRALVETLAEGIAAQLDEYPWYRGADFALPLTPGVGDIPTRANAVRRDCASHGVTCLTPICEPVLVGRYNELVRATRNKAVVLLMAVQRIIARYLAASPDELVRIYVDRLGGRLHYREALTTAFPGYELQIVEESERHSAYRLTRPGIRCELAFAMGGDSRYLPTALASMYSKYLRELFMHRFNAFWGEKVPGLRSTAGYYTDACRWLKEAEAALNQLGVARDLLVRRR